MCHTCTTLHFSVIRFSWFDWFVIFLQINAMVFCGVVKEMVTMPSTRSRKFHAIKLVTQSVCFSFFCFKGPFRTPLSVYGGWWAYGCGARASHRRRFPPPFLNQRWRLIAPLISCLEPQILWNYIFINTMRLARSSGRSRKNYTLIFWLKHY